MRFPLLPVIFLLFFNGAIDYYIYRVVNSRCVLKKWRIVQLVTAVAMAIFLIVIIAMPKRTGSNAVLYSVMWMLFTYLSIYVAKIIYVVFDLISKIPQLWKAKRLKWLSWTGLSISIAAFGLMWWGALINRYNIELIEQEVEIHRLPKSFDGFKIAQISDLHVGSYGSDTAYVSYLVDSINALKPDLIVFTGDIVNRRTDELLPFTSALARLEAPYGVCSVLGNHDYGDYSEWPSEEAKSQNVQDLKDMQAAMGWHMLNNSTRWLRRGTDSIALIGVENVGDPPFKTYGDLKAAYDDLGDENVKILLTHNPAHWIMQISDNPDVNVDLSLSGHTHAMQIELVGWSPAEWRYPTWGGMYDDDKNNRLYVNRGVGEVAFPARIGATPEITLFTLKSN